MDVLIMLFMRQETTIGPPHLRTIADVFLDDDPLLHTHACIQRKIHPIAQFMPDKGDQRGNRDKSKKPHKRVRNTSIMTFVTNI
jgi:hypothetical protein